MPVEIHIKLGNMLVRVMGDHLKSVMPEAAFLGEVAVRCKGHPNVAFLYRNPKGYDYYGVVDLDTGYELIFGQKKETKELFLRADAEWAPPYSGGRSYGEDGDRGEPGSGEPADQEEPPARPAQPQRPPPAPDRRPAAPPPRPQQAPQRPPSRPGERKW